MSRTILTQNIDLKDLTNREFRNTELKLIVEQRRLKSESEDKRLVKQYPYGLGDFGALIQIIRKSLAFGLFAMPKAFMIAGIFGGVCMTALISLVCLHSTYSLVNCAHMLYVNGGLLYMSLPQVVEASFKYGPTRFRSYGKIASNITAVLLHMSYFLIMIVSSVIMATGMAGVLSYILDFDLNKQKFILYSYPIFILLAWVPNMQQVLALSIGAHICQVCIITILCTYLFSEVPSLDTVSWWNYKTFPVFMSITLFTLQTVSFVMPLENAMISPHHLTGWNGVLFKGAMIWTGLYIVIGFFGYLKFGENVLANVNFNLPVDSIDGQIAKLMGGFTAYFTFALNFFIFFTGIWGILVRDTKLIRNTPWNNYICRTIVVTMPLMIGYTFPGITQLIGFIGAMSFCVIGIFVPIVVEFNTFWGIGYGCGYWKIFSFVFKTCCAILACVFGFIEFASSFVELFGAHPGNQTVNSDFVLMARQFNILNVYL